MDDDICRWILDFIIQTSMRDHLLKKTLAAIPVSDKDPRLKKSVLLRTIESDISDAEITVTILEILEMIEELDRIEGIGVMESMKAAYCAVALECTVKYLVGGVRMNGKYFDAVKKIWRGRVVGMEREGMSELVSRELKGRKFEVEAAILDTNVSKKFTNMNSRNDALRLVAEYLREAWAVFGPSFLQWFAATLIDKEMKNFRNELPSQRTNFAELERPGDQEVFREDKRKGINSPNVSQDFCINNGFENLGVVVNDEEVREVDTKKADHTRENRMHEIVSEGRVLDDQNRSFGITDKPVALDGENLKNRDLPRRKFLSSHKRTRGGAKISYPKDLENDTSSSKHRRLLTPEVNRVQEALKVSSLDLQAVVKDPLPDALSVSEAVISNLAEKNNSHDLFSEYRKVADATDPATNKDDELPDLGNPCYCHQQIVLHPSWMEHNSITRTHKWDDSTESSPERIDNHTRQLHLPSPKRNFPSKVVQRRKMKRWSLLEEDTLRAGVQKYGKGNWKLILNSYRDVFEERTEVDLKDKWRNLTRY